MDAIHTQVVQSKMDDIEERVEYALENAEKVNNAARLEALAFEYTEPQESRLLLKLDIIVLGYVSGAYLLAYMDRGNIGNANTAGMSADLGIDDNQYQ